MTSTSFNIGLTTDKNSSRVLRPPGGSHSDIFGLRDVQNEIVTPIKKRAAPQSTIDGCFKMEEKKDKARTAEGEIGVANREEVEQKEGDEKEIDENEAPGKEESQIEDLPKTEEKDDPIPASKRGRVPPGGFSSGLW